MRTPSIRALSALADDGEFDPGQLPSPDVLESLSLIDHAAPVIGDHGRYERARRRARERRSRALIPEWFAAEDLTVAPWEAAGSHFI